MLNVVPLVNEIRGSIVESVHLGALAVVDADGKLLHSMGDPYLVTYPRSSTKPLQVLPFVESGGLDHFDLSDRQLAVMCASHSGEPFHVECVQSILRAIGLDRTALMCGVHPPSSKAAAQALAEAGKKPNTLHSNCSGKHSGMLAMARYLGVPHEGYYRPDHPVQQRIIATLSEFTSVPATEIPLASDGCTVPTFALPLYNFALAFARLVQPDRWSPDRQAACRRIMHAMQTYPEMVAGTERLDTDLMRVAGGSLIAKGGAEGYVAAGILPSTAFPRGAGVVLKISDGDAPEHARPVATIAVLRQLGVLSDGQVEALADYASKPVKNMRGEVVGEIQAAFSIV